MNMYALHSLGIGGATCFAAGTERVPNKVLQREERWSQVKQSENR